MPHPIKKNKNLPRGRTELRKTPFAGTQSPRGDLQRSPWTTPPEKTKTGHPLALPGMPSPDHPKAPKSPSGDKFSKSTQDSQSRHTSTKRTPNASRSPSEAPRTAKAPASGTMSYTPENATVRASVTSGGDRASQEIISGTEAVRRAGDEAARKKMERLLWGIGGNPR